MHLVQTMAYAGEKPWHGLGNKLAPQQAIEVWKRVESQDPIYLALVGERIMDAHAKLGRVEQGQTLLRSWLERHPSLDLLDEVFHWALEKEGSRAAYDLVREELRRNPANGWSLHGLSASLIAQGKKDEAAKVRERFSVVWSRADVKIPSSCYCVSE